LFLFLAVKKFFAPSRIPAPNKNSIPEIGTGSPGSGGGGPGCASANLKKKKNIIQIKDFLMM